MRDTLALIKLGGSVVTFKDKPLTANFEAIEKISGALSSIRVPIIVIHGGGSFGHYWSTVYDMHSKADAYDPKGISIVHESMVALNQIIINSMIKQDMTPYSIMPSILTSGNKPVVKKIKELKIMAKSGIIPVIYGDIVHIENGKYSIVSGDVLMTIISRILHPSRVVFTLNADGFYKDLEKKEVIKVITGPIRNHNKSVKFFNVDLDVTGGMRRKVSEAFKISKYGIDVLMINGLKPERIRNALSGSSFEGTLFKGHQGRSKK
jgi:isopentenyl phosphate kinase